MINVRHKATGLVGRVIKLEATDSNVLVNVDSAYIQIRGVYSIQQYLANFEAVGLHENGKEQPKATPDWRALYV